MNPATNSILLRKRIWSYLEWCWVPITVARSISEITACTIDSEIWDLQRRREKSELGQGLGRNDETWKVLESDKVHQLSIAPVLPDNSLGWGLNDLIWD